MMAHTRFIMAVLAVFHNSYKTAGGKKKRICMKLRWVGNGHFCSAAYTHGDDKHFSAFNKQEKQPNAQKKERKKTKNKHNPPAYLWLQIELWLVSLNEILSLYLQISFIISLSS